MKEGYHMKRVVIVHAWGENPTSCWYQWLENMLENEGIEVNVPVMPNPTTPDIRLWIDKLNETIGDADRQTYLVGHSIGCQTILRYLENLRGGEQIGGVVFVAPWTHIIGLSEASRQIAEPWLETPIDWQAARTHCPQFFSFFSSDDVWVPLSETKVFEDSLGAQIKIIPAAKHFDGIRQLPELLTEVLKMTQPPIANAEEFTKTVRIMANTRPISNGEIIKRSKSSKK
jgi:predicted alpha/beta hydrolase family esterase